MVKAEEIVLPTGIIQVPKKGSQANVCWVDKRSIEVIAAYPPDISLF